MLSAGCWVWRRGRGRVCASERHGKRQQRPCRRARVSQPSLTSRTLPAPLTKQQGAPAAEVAAAKGTAAQVVSEFLRSPDLYHFDLASNPAVAQLASDAAHAPLHRLLSIFLGGSVAEYSAHVAAHPALLSSLGLSSEAALAKMQLLALMGLAHGASEVTFGEIQAALGIPEVEVEAAVVQAIGKRVLEARINQLAGTVAVTKCAPRTFGGEQWGELAAQLEGWARTVATLRALGEEQKSSGVTAALTLPLPVHGA